MNHLVIAHGKPKREVYTDPLQPKPPRSHWFPWLAREAARRGVSANIPAFPEPYAPDYKKWADIFNPIRIDRQTGVVGFSAGGGLHFGGFLNILMFRLKSCYGWTMA